LASEAAHVLKTVIKTAENSKNLKQHDFYFKVEDFSENK